jgi:hypothetical protein
MAQDWHLQANNHAAAEGFSLKDNISLPILKLKERIISYLENRYSKLGKHDAVSWRGIWIESGATEEEFRAALSVAAKTEIVFVDSDHIRLSFRGTLMKKPPLPTIASSNATTSSEQRLHGHVVTLIRSFFQFARKQSLGG